MEAVQIIPQERISECDGNSFISTDVLHHMKTNWGEKLAYEEVDVMIREADTDDVVNSSFLSGVHAHLAREQMLARHAMLSVLISVYLVSSAKNSSHHAMVRA